MRLGRALASGAIMRRPDIRNLAIVAHVDHGKTTLVDAMLRQSGVFRANEQVIDRVMDSNVLERERGITIMAKNTSILWGETRINIVDTPGHSDFGGEIDRADARAPEVLDEVYDLFIDLGANESQLDFPVLYTQARAGTASFRLDVPSENLVPLFDAIVAHLPGPEVDPEATLQFQVNNIDYDDYVGRLAVGRIIAGSMTVSQNYSLCRRDGKTVVCKVAHIYGWQGLTRVERETASAGQIVIVAGVGDIAIGERIPDPENPRPLPPIRIDEPTVAMTFSVNNSPWAGREGDFVTSRKLGERIEFEARRDVSARVEQLTPDAWRVMGRGELQLGVIVETMRREGYEMQVSKPTVITKQAGGEILEPMEMLVIDIPSEYIGVVT